MEKQESARGQGRKKVKTCKEGWKDAKVPRLGMQTYSTSETDMPETDLTCGFVSIKCCVDVTILNPILKCYSSDFSMGMNKACYKTILNE